MKLYFAPGACSLAVRIALLEAGIPFTSTQVDLMAKTYDNGADYRAVNAQGSVPVLELDNGERVTEVAAILQYVADQAPAAALAPAQGSFARVRLQETLNFIASEIHKGWSPRFNPTFDDATKAFFTERLVSKYAVLNARLDKTTWVNGDAFSVADAYLFVTLLWRNFIPTELPGQTALDAFMQRMMARPAVQQALAAEGLVK